MLGTSIHAQQIQTHWHARFTWRAVTNARGPQRVSVTGAGENVSDGEGVGVMLFLMRYQIVIATRREINFARQFSSVSLIHRTETNTARQFFGVCPFIIAVQQNFPRGIKSHAAK